MRVGRRHLRLIGLRPAIDHPVERRQATVHRVGGPRLLDLAVTGDAVRAVAEADERDHVATAGADEEPTLNVLLMHTHCRAPPSPKKCCYDAA